MKKDLVGISLFSRSGKVIHGVREGHSWGQGRSIVG